jgi:hypothetical protein
MFVYVDLNNLIGAMLELFDALATKVPANARDYIHAYTT